MLWVKGPCTRTGYTADRYQRIQYFFFYSRSRSNRKMDKIVSCVRFQNLETKSNFYIILYQRLFCSLRQWKTRSKMNEKLTTEPLTKERQIAKCALNTVAKMNSSTRQQKIIKWWQYISIFRRQRNRARSIVTFFRGASTYCYNIAIYIAQCSLLYCRIANEINWKLSL